MKILKKVKWIYKITTNVEYKYSAFNDIHFDSDWLLIKDGIATVKASIKKPFAWDGATPKFNLFGKTFGTPDGKIDKLTGKSKTYYGTLIHDALYQFAPQNKITRKQADLIMLAECKKTNFKLAYIYYSIIRLFGGYWWKKRQRK